VIVAMHRRTALIGLVTAGLIALACLPAAVTFGLGWLRLPHIEPWGQPPAKDPTSPEAWALFAVFYLFWMVGLTVLMIWSFERIGHRWRYYESTPRPQKKSRRRARATMRHVGAEQQATMEALRRREEREARRRHDRERDEALRRGPDGGGR
jgi:hypothetical protein